MKDLNAAAVAVIGAKRLDTSPSTLKFAAKIAEC